MSSQSGRRVFFPGDRIEFESLHRTGAIFRGVVDKYIPPIDESNGIRRRGLYMVTHEGEKKSRPVALERVRARVHRFTDGWRGGTAA